MRYRFTLTVVVVAVLAPHAVPAQTSRDAGVSLSLGYAQYVDVPRDCCPLAPWVTFGSGRFKLHLDYLRSHRYDGEGYGGYPLEHCTRDGKCVDVKIDGKRASTQRASIEVETMHEVNVLAAWRAWSRPDHQFRILIGGGYRRSKRIDCTAFAGPSVRVPTPADYPSDYVVFRAELTDEDRRRCKEDSYILQGPIPQGCGSSSSTAQGASASGTARAT